MYFCGIKTAIEETFYLDNGGKNGEVNDCNG